MAGKRDARRLYWQDLLDRHAKSGLSIRQFCFRQGISEPSFYMWRRRLGSSTVAEPQPASRGEHRLKTDREFIPLTLLDESGTLEVIHPHGYRVRVTGDVNARALECILNILDGRHAQ